MITLYCGGEGFGLPEVSPFATKTEVQLKMAGLAYRKLNARPMDGPKGQLPFIEADDVRLGDSTFIRGWLERQYGLDLDKGLDARQRAEAWAIERMLENHLHWFGVETRWLSPDNFEKGPAHFFDEAPEAVRDELRGQALERVRTAVHAAGVTRHAEAERLVLALRSLAALQALLGDSRYLFGDHPCGADATAFAFVLFQRAPLFDSPLRRQVETMRPLVAYVDRMMDEFYPEFLWTEARASAGGSKRTAPVN
jgi:glutathione S-transferase